MKRNALGKGLSALIPEAPTRSGPGVLQLDIGLIDSSPSQPRRAFPDDGLGELAESIREHGLLQPIIVSRQGERYRLIAGERRWRAASRAGLTRIPAVVRDVTDQQRLELALVENVQRQDLNPIEEARAFEMLVRDFSLSHEDLARRVAKSRPYVSNILRLLSLSEKVMAHVETGRLSMGHARALAALPDHKYQTKVAEQIISQGLSVRRSEALISRLLSMAGDAGGPAGRRAGEIAEGARRDPNVLDAEERLKRALGTTVRIIGGNARGRIEVHYASARELQRLFEALQRAGRSAPPPPAIESRTILPGSHLRPEGED